MNKNLILWLVICILVATSSIQFGYIMAKREDSWKHEIKYNQLNTKVMLLESEVRILKERKVK